MNRKKIAALMVATVVSSSSAPTLRALANDVPIKSGLLENAKSIKAGTTINKFQLLGNSNIGSYDKIYKMDNSNIESITNNGGNYNSASILKNSIDGNLNTHWETGKQNSSNFTNEIVFKLHEKTTLNRIVYAARQTGSPGKGFANKFEIYGSLTDDEDDFQLVSDGEYSGSTNDVIEIKFNNTEFKRIKFKFIKANQDWASASEFMFYKEDILSDKVASLFTDSTMSVVSDEFNTIDKLNELETELKEHPLYESYKEDLDNAKKLILQEDIQPVQIKTKVFNNYSNDAYSNSFKISSDKIKGIKNNGGNYGNAVIGNAIDENLDTYWETNKTNTDSFSNEIEVEFKEDVKINRIVYGARKSDLRGFANEFEIYGSTTSKGDTYKLIGTGGYNKTSGLVEGKFDPIELKRIKFKFKKADQNWPTLSELAFYKEDVVDDKMDRLFTNELKEELSEEFDTIEKVQSLENEVKGHPLEDSYKESLVLAKEILNGELKTVKTIIAEQHGNMEKHARDNLKFGFGNNNQPTGISAKPGEKITVYVDADPTKPMPKLAFSQQEGSFANWIRTVDLKPGKNVITVPEVPKDKWYQFDVIKGGAIYIVNPYTKEQQPKTPVIRFESGNKFPFLTADTDIEEFKKSLIEYKKAVDEDVAKNPNVEDRTVIDVFEFVSDHLVWTGTATGAYEAYIKKGEDPLATINSYNNYMREIFDYYGLDGSNEKNDPKYIRENVRLAQPFGYMYAAGGHVGVQKDVMASLLVPFEKGAPIWGLTHEIGHKMDVNARLYGEVTNNMLPMHMSAYYNRVDNRIPYEAKTYKNTLSENSNKYQNGGYFENLAVFWQLEMYKPGYWGELNSLYRERNVNLGSEDPENVKMQYLVKFSSEVIGEDLSEYFARHGFTVNEETRNELKKYPKPSGKIWYLNNNKIGYNGDGFTKDPELDVSLSIENNGTRLNFTIDNTVKSDLLGYEILKDGEVIGFTSTNTFLDDTEGSSKNSKYEVKPYGLDLKTADSVVVNSLAPTISIQQKRIILKLNEEFDPLSYIRVLDNDGNDITSKTKVTSNVDTNKTGNYTVKYTAEENGVSSEKVVEVEVVNTYEYLSDEKWLAVETQWGTPRRNSNITGKVNGLKKTFEKGFAIHANGNITYDISDQNYERFEALLGVDTSIAQNTNSSIRFQIIGDGKILYTSNTLKYADNMEYVNIPVKGIKKLEIKVSDAGNGNTSDHSVIANPKLTINDYKPKIKADNIVRKINDSIDLKEGVTAIDFEDGDITSKIQVTGDVDFGKVGNYEVTYRVTDSDNNETVKVRTISVVDMDDFEYLSDRNWKSANNSYGTVNKDKSESGGKLSLTGDDQKAVLYDKGIGTHANSTIIYDLTDKNYGYFTSYVGVDRAMYGNPNSSIIFQVYVDGELEFDSGLMESKTPQKYVEVPINGAKELKLVVTDGAIKGNANDHATWGDSKLHFLDNFQEEYEKLKVLIEKVDSLDRDHYTATTWDVLQTELQNAKMIMGNEEATIADIVKAYDRLNHAFTSLEIAVDKSNLEALVKEAEAKDTSVYTKESVEKFNEELLNAKDILNKENATQSEINEAINNLKDAISNLEVIKVDKSELMQLVEKINALDKDKYTISTWDELQVELEKANNVIQNENATEEVVKDSYNSLNKAFLNLELVKIEADKVDKTELLALIDAINALDKDDYTNSSWSALQFEVESVNKVIQNENASEAEVKEAYNNLMGAYNNLVRIADKSKLEALIKEAEDIEESKYTVESINKLNAQLENAKVILNNQEATQAEVNEAIAELKDVMSKLEFNKIDKTELIILVEKVNALDKNNYTTSSWDALQVELEKANNVIQNENAMEEEVNNTYNSLNKAFLNLELVEMEVDKSKLELLVEKAENMDLSKYTAESVEKFNVQLSNSKDILVKENVTQEEVDLAMGGLMDAIGGLVKKVDKTEIMALIDAINSLNKNNYTSSSWSALQSEVENVNKIIQNENATGEEVKEAHDKLMNAYNNLKKVADKSKLEELIKEAERLEESKYTTESIAKLNEQLSNAKDILSNDEVTQIEVNELVKKLKLTLGNLELIQNNNQGSNNNPGGDNDNSNVDNDNPSGDNDNSNGDNDNPSGDNDNSNGDNNNPGGDNDNSNGDNNNPGGDSSNSNGDINDPNDENINSNDIGGNGNSSLEKSNSEKIDKITLPKTGNDVAIAVGAMALIATGIGLALKRRK